MPIRVNGVQTRMQSIKSAAGGSIINEGQDEIDKVPRAGPAKLRNQLWFCSQLLTSLWCVEICNILETLANFRDCS